MDPEAMRRRGKQKILFGVGLLVLVIVITIIMLPNYYR
jgi:hypothetical protein